MSLKALCSRALMIGITLAAGPAGAQTSTAKSPTSKTDARTETKSIEGTVLAVDGNNLVLKMSTGEIRHIVASDSQRALIEGKEVAAKDLKVGTHLKATITTTTTSLVDRTVTVGSGKVWYVAGNNVILTLPNGQNRQYKVADDYKFMVEGKPATVFDLRKGMSVSAVKIVEAPRTEVATNTVVTGKPPAPIATVSAPVSTTAPSPTPSSSAPAGSSPAGAPVTAAKLVPTDTPAAAEPASAPSAPSLTASPLLLTGLGVTVLIACVVGFRALNRKKA